MIAALFVQSGGGYFGLPDVDPWDVKRDARLYPGPWPVVAHPPCARWGRYASGGPSRPASAVVGDDEACFAAAFESVRSFGGVLEHPAGSKAWERFGLMTPLPSGGWCSVGMFQPGWTCCVDQGWFGLPARKPTWLYAVGCELPSLPWGRSFPRYGFRPLETLSARQRAATPPAFRDVLLGMARSVLAPGLEGLSSVPAAREDNA